MKRKNFGGMYQFAVATAEDLKRLAELDRALWAATSAPLRDLHCDQQFLEAMDTEGAGRIRVAQVLDACSWTLERLQDTAGVLAGSDVLALSALAGNAAGQALRHAAAHLLSELGLSGQASVSLDEVRRFRAGYATSLANGDGVVPPAALPDADAAGLAQAILHTVGGRPDVGGSLGVGREELAKFQAGAAQWLQWHRAAPAALVLGTATAQAFQALTALAQPLTDYFAQCDLLAQQHPATAPQLIAPEPLWSADGSSIETFLQQAPLAAPNLRGELPPIDQVNPSYSARVQAFFETVLTHIPDLGGQPLTREVWQQAVAFLQPYADWRGAEPKEPYAALGELRLVELLDPDLADRLLQAVAIDEAAAPGVQAVADVERLVLNQQNLVALANNFVNFSAIYNNDNRVRRALIDAGNLVIDGRQLGFCIRVEGRDAHKKVAADSLCYLLYADILAKEGAEVVYRIAAPVTSGERGRLRVGKRGLFVDNQNKEFDAIVVDIIENPISVKEAALAPFRRAGKMVSEKMEQWLGSQQADAEKGLTAHSDKAVQSAQQAGTNLIKETKELDAKASQPAKPAEVKPADPKPAEAKAPAAAEPDKPKEGINANTLILGGGMALAGVGALLASLISMLTSLNGWLAILGVVALVAALSGLLGWLKLRRRDMSLLLEANGWAVNAEMKVTRRIARLFTWVPADPPGTTVDRFDSLAYLTAAQDKLRRRNLILLALLLALCAAAVVALRYHGFV